MERRCRADRTGPLLRVLVSSAVALAACGERSGPPPTDDPGGNHPRAASLAEFIDESRLDPGLLQKLEVPDIRRIEDFLQTTVVPRAEFSDMGFHDALSEIQRLAVVHSATGESISVIVDSSLAGPDQSEGTLTEVFVDRSVIELFEEVAARFSHWCQVDSYAVKFYPNAVPKPVHVTAALPVEPELLAKLASLPDDHEDPFASGDGAENEKDSVMALLGRAGVALGGGGANAVYDEGSSRLIVRATMEQLERVAECLERLSENGEGD